MAGGYSISAGGVTIVNAVVTLIFVNPIAAPSVDLIFRRFWVGNSNNNTAANVRVQIETQVTSFPTLTSATPAKLHLNNPASVITGGTAGAAGTAGTNASGEGAGAKTVMLNDVFNNNNGWLLVLTPEELIEMSAGSTSGLGLYLPVAVGASPATLNWTFGCNWSED